MLTVEQALARVLVDVPRMPSERVPLHLAYGRVLAEDLVSAVDVPPWDNSAMDGYAVRAADLVAGGATLDLNEVVAAGGWPRAPVAPGTATAVMTGAPIPAGADAVVMIEDTDRAMSGRVAVRTAARVGDHIRRRAGDIASGSVVVRRGQELAAGYVGLASSLGLTEVAVARRPVVAILSTGDEVVAPGAALGPGQIYSSNNASLAGLVLAAGAVPRDEGIAVDRTEALVEALRRSVLGADVVLTTGGVSVGEFDFVKDAFHELGAGVDFWKVRMKPGKPLAFGRVGRVPLFGLPGNPVSCMVNFLQFVRPWLRTALGVPRPFLPVLEATVAEPIREHPGRESFVRVSLALEEDRVVCRPAGSQSSGVLGAMARAHGLALLPSSSSGVAVGERVRVQLLDASFLDRAEPGYGW